MCRPGKTSPGGIGSCHHGMVCPFFLIPIGMGGDHQPFHGYIRLWSLLLWQLVASSKASIALYTVLGVFFLRLSQQPAPISCKDSALLQHIIPIAS